MKRADAEDELSMRHGIQDLVRHIFSELNRLVGMAARAKPATLVSNVFGHHDDTCYPESSKKQFPITLPITTKGKDTL
jgi:hypothetical protein